MPCYSRREKIFYGTGLKIYDLLAGKYNIGRSRILSRKETLERLPSVKTEGLTGGVLYYDAQFDDTRLLIDLALYRRKPGAAISELHRVPKLLKPIKTETDRRGMPRFDRRPAVQRKNKSRDKCCRRFFRPGNENGRCRRPSRFLTFSQGIHLVFDGKFLPGDAALMIPKTSDGRVLFCIPWKDHLLVGTTDTPVDAPLLEPKALQSEIDFVLETAGQYLSAKPSRSDILSVFAGIRPLVRPSRRAKTSAVSRGHHVFVGDSGLVTITGGKWTTYRRMAEDAVDHGGPDRRARRLAVRSPNTSDRGI